MNLLICIWVTKMSKKRDFKLGLHVSMYSSLNGLSYWLMHGLKLAEIANRKMLADLAVNDAAAFTALADAAKAKLGK